MPNTIYEIQTRGILTTTSSLPEGSQALFNASGGISITNNVYTYDGHSWKNNDIIQTSSATETILTALYPAYNGANDFITQNPYTTDGALEDVLMAQAVFTNQTNIELKFHHLFSLLTIHVQDELNETLSEVSLKAPKVENINPISGDISISDEHTTLLNKNTIGEYSFIVPPSANANIVLTFRFTDNEVSHQLTHSFLKGNKYECNVIKADTQPGIRNADDLIAFAELINNPSYNGTRKLEEFRTINNSDTIYHLLADITLNETQCKKLNPIGGYNSKRPFTCIFDGKEHTISNLKLKASSGYTGLFGKITATAIIKNLTLNNCYSSTISSSSKTGSGILVGYNEEGTITNCHIKNSSLENEDNTYLGGITGLNKGMIINCSTTNTTFICSKLGTSGPIAGRSEMGNILNSYSSSNSTKGDNKYKGGICGYSVNSTITNCYVFSNNNVEGHIIGIGENSTISDSFYDSTPTIGYNTNCTRTNNKKYNTDFTTTINDSIIPIYILLNKWVEEQNSNIFKIWTIAPDGSPCFE